MRNVLHAANSMRRNFRTLLFALFCAGQIDYITLRAFVDLDTEIIENYFFWGGILRQKVSIKLSIRVNFARCSVIPEIVQKDWLVCIRG